MQDEDLFHRFAVPLPRVRGRLGRVGSEAEQGVELGFVEADDEVFAVDGGDGDDEVAGDLVALIAVGVAELDVVLFVGYASGFEVFLDFVAPGALSDGIDFDHLGFLLYIDDDC